MNGERGADGQSITIRPQSAAWAVARKGWIPLWAALVFDAFMRWIGAAFMKVLTPWIDPALAARLPFALLLTATLALVWYATLHLARTEAAQPVAFAFGGEAHPVDYARAMADGAVLALMASLGLLQLGHETTPELVQLAATALLLYALAASPYRIGASRAAALVALTSLAASGAGEQKSRLDALRIGLAVGEPEPAAPERRGRRESAAEKTQRGRAGALKPRVVRRKQGAVGTSEIECCHVRLPVRARRCQRNAPSGTRRRW